MRPANLATYKAAFPIYVDIVDYPYKKWTAYYWDGIVLSIVTQLDDGRIARFQDVGDVFDYDGDDYTQADLLDTPDKPEFFDSVEAMIEHDRKQDEEYSQ